MSENISISKLSNLLLSLDNILIFTHERPDGDAIGSVVSLLKLFNKLKKKAYAYFPESIPKQYSQYLCDNIFVGNYPSNLNFTNCIGLDCSNIERLAVIKERKNDIFSSPIINIDHHYDNGLFGTYNYIDSSASSTAEIIYDIVSVSSKWVLTPDIATTIIMGILMDTGGFRFDNTSSNVLKKTAQLMELGGNYIETVKSMYFKKPYNLYQYEADIAVNHLKMKFNNRFAYFYMSNRALEQYNLSKSDTEGLIDTIRIIDGVDIAAILAEKDNGFKVSLRSNNLKFPVSTIAHKLNGGGHKLAAGCFINENSIDKAEKILLEHVRNIFQTQ